MPRESAFRCVPWLKAGGILTTEGTETAFTGAESDWGRGDETVIHMKRWVAHSCIPQKCMIQICAMVV